MPIGSFKELEFPNDETSSTAEPLSLRDKVYGYLRHKMQNGNLFPGAVIDQKEICSEMGISRTPLTNALIRLEAEGIVTIHPRSRVIVNKLEEEDIQYLYEVIGAIEGTLIAKGFLNYTSDILTMMESWNKQMRVHIKNGDLRAFDPLHYRFHQVFVLMAPNKFAERILYPIKNRLWDIPKKSFPQQWYLDACTEHQFVIDALRENNVDKAVSYHKHVHWDFELNKKYIQMAYYL
jgi:DNA-binding GntR family transcriptional regulator